MVTHEYKTTGVTKHLPNACDKDETKYKLHIMFEKHDMIIGFHALLIRDQCWFYHCAKVFIFMCCIVTRVFAFIKIAHVFVCVFNKTKHKSTAIMLPWKKFLMLIFYRHVALWQ